jgi:hypothetical protein
MSSKVRTLTPRTRFRSRRRDLIALLQSINVADSDVVEDVIALWGPRVKDDARFWAEF